MKDFRLKTIYKKFVESNEKEISGISRIIQIMPKLLTLSRQTLANTAVNCIVTLYFKHAEHFLISRFANHLRHFILIVHK